MKINTFRTLILGAVFSLALISCNHEVSQICLDEMDLSQMETGWGRVNINKTVDGNPLKIADSVYERGVGTHAVSKFLINLNRDAVSFEALVGLDDESGEKGSVEFFVLGDRKILFQSGVMRRGDPAKKVMVDLKGISRLGLYIGNGGDDINYDHADWIDAKIDYKGEKPTAIAGVSSEKYILSPAISAEPRINGPMITGARAGNPFLFRLPVTGQKPIEIQIENLPEGLVFDAEKRIIHGIAPDKGIYNLMIHAKNQKGENSRGFVINTKDGLALTPPMGWNSWNCWGLSVDQQKVKAAADAMIQSGLADHGWTYINIDDGWEAEKRTDRGELLANDKFPNMKDLSDYLHNYGLKLGIYSSPGKYTCGGYLGSFNHEKQDAETWSDWGIDYLKYDWCSYTDEAKDFSLPELKRPYIIMNEVLNQLNRDIVYSLCQYGMGDVYTWGESVGGNLWRTTGDITDTWGSMAGIGFKQDISSDYAGPGHWNDPDMLVVGEVGWGPSLHPSNLTADEQYTHISLWSLLAAPLLIGCDMSQMDDFTLSLLTNDEVIEINQDPLGIQAHPVKKQAGFEIWSKKLYDGSYAVGLFYNGSASPVESFRWDDAQNNMEIELLFELLGITGKYAVRDVWTQKDLGEFTDVFTADVPYHGVKLLKISK